MIDLTPPTIESYLPLDEALQQNNENDAEEYDFFSYYRLFLQLVPLQNTKDLISKSVDCICIFNVYAYLSYSLIRFVVHLKATFRGAVILDQQGRRSVCSLLLKHSSVSLINDKCRMLKLSIFLSGFPSYCFSTLCYYPKVLQTITIAIIWN